MEFLPLFHNLRGSRVLVVGGGEIALRKSRLLADAGAVLRVVAPRIEKQLCELVNSGGGAFAYVYLSDLATNDIAPGASFTDSSQATISGGRVNVRTNISAQIRSRNAFSDGSTGLTINTLGWIDRRGRDN